jgi:glycosyltransferase involved in cell wall biosynthesis
MKILLVHNTYQKSGGEDAVFQNEGDLLKQHGNTVIHETKDNEEINGVVQKVKTALNTIYSVRARKAFSHRLKRERPDIIHIHNFFPLFTPAIFYAAKALRIPTVFTLHNYRIICPTAVLMHQGKINERSIKSGPFWTIPHKVYKDSIFGTFALASMILFHKVIGTWKNQVDCFVVLTEFAKNKFIEAGIPADKIKVKPNFIPDPHNKETAIDKKGGYAIYAGRLSTEKGVSTLLKSWESIDYPLKIVGDGPLMEEVVAAQNPNIEILGFQQNEDVQRLIQHADFLIMPSEWYEGFPMTLLESFANSTPALVSDIGSLAEIVEHGKTGLKFEAGNTESLIKTVETFLNDSNRQELSVNARRAYLAHYTPSKNYKSLMSIYQGNLA